MKKFSYSLAGVLRVRKIQEEQKKAEVAKAAAEKKKLSNELSRLAGEVLASKKRLRSSGLVDIGDYRLNEQYLEGIKLRSAELQNKIQKLDLRLEKLKQELRLCTLETKKLETHYDKEKQAWKEAAVKEEQAEFDDIANSRRL